MLISELYKIEDSKKFFLLLLKEYKVYHKFRKFIIKHRKYLGTSRMIFSSILIDHFINDKSPRCLFNALDEAKYKSQGGLDDIFTFSMYCGRYLSSCLLRRIDKYKEYHNY